MRGALATALVLAVPITLAGCKGAKLGLRGEGRDEPKQGCWARVALVSNTRDASGQEQARGLELARDEINAAGGIAGCRVHLVIDDDGNDPTKARDLAREQVRAPRLLALVGTNSTGSTMSALSVAEAARVPFLVPSVSGGLVTSVGYRWVFRLAAPDYALVAALFDFLGTLPRANELRTYGVVYPRSVSSQGMFIAVQNAARARGGAVVVAEEYEQGGRPLGQHLARVKGASPDVVFVDAASQRADDALTLLRESRELDLRPRAFLALAGPFVEPAFAAAGEGVIVGAQWSPRAPWRDEAGQTAAAFAARYEQRFRAAPGPRAVASYTALHVLRQALEQASGGAPLDWANIEHVRLLARAGLQNVRMSDTLFGPVQFDANGQNAHPVLVTQVQGGAHVIVHPESVRAAAAVLPSPAASGAP